MTSNKMAASEMKLSICEKKTLRKQAKGKQTLSKTDGIEFATNPSRFVIIMNFGLTTGASQRDLIEIFQKYGKINNIVLVPDKQYSFLEFASEESAEKAVNSAQGLQIASGNNPIKVVLCLAYVKTVPQQTDEKTEKLPPGLLLFENFISSEYENVLLNMINWNQDVQTENSEENLKHRKVKHFGYEFKYKTSTVDKDDPLEEEIPTICQPLLEKLVSEKLVPTKPDQLTVNRYEPGQGIPPHIDTHSAFEDGIVSLSLGSAVVMNFTDINNLQIPVVLPRCSLIVMTGESRFKWNHGIVPRKTDVVPSSDGGGGLTLTHRGTRISFTFRRVRREPCRCEYPEFCDSQKGERKEPDENCNVEEVYVKQVYDVIAEHFSETRHKPWPKVVEFLQSLSAGSIVLDIGCGNGKYFNSNPYLFHIGCDQNLKLLQICNSRHFEVYSSDVVYLSLRRDCCDACICIAVIHHLQTEERRLTAISNLVHSVRPDGKILIYVWAMEQELDSRKSSYIKNGKVKSIQTQTSTKTTGDDSNLPFPIHVNRTHFEHPDILVPWSLKSDQRQTYYRYYHLFQAEELENLCKKLPNVSLLSSYYDRGNWCVILQKKNKLN